MIKLDIHHWTHVGHLQLSETLWKFEQFGRLIGCLTGLRKIIVRQESQEKNSTCNVYRKIVIIYGNMIVIMEVFPNEVWLICLILLKKP